MNDENSLARNRAPRRKTILVVDDEPQVRELLQSALNEMDFAIEQAGSTAYALELANSKKIDGFILDINIGGNKEGIGLCRQLRALRAYRTAPILMLTADVDMAIEEASFLAGCDDFVHKPVMPRLLGARLKVHFQHNDDLKEINMTRAALGRYVSSRAKQIVSAVGTGKVMPEQVDVVICFTDVRGFTALSEEIEPHLLFSTLSEHMAQQEELIYSYGGYVDKFGGDGIMAVFDGDDMAKRGCLCALEILDLARAGKADSLSERLWQIGIGLHTGRVIRGNFGSDSHRDYTVIGNAVNIAARLCGQAVPMSIIVSDDLRKAVPADREFDFVFGRSVPIRGRKEPMEIFNLVRTWPCRFRLRHGQPTPAPSALPLRRRP